MVRYLFQVGLLLAVALYAWRRGGWPERAAAAALAAMFALDAAYHWLDRAPQWREVSLWHMSLDLALLAALVGLALRAPRIWTLWLASFQLVSALGQILRLFEVAMPVRVYWAMTAAPSYCQILLLAAGIYLNDQRRGDSATT